MPKNDKKIIGYSVEYRLRKGGCILNTIFNDLELKFNEIHNCGWIKSINKNYNGVGMTFERCLGKEEDDFAYPDFQGIEIKTQRIKTSYPITLFGAAPWGEDWPEADRIRKLYGYFDYESEDVKKLNVEFYCSKNVLVCNRYFFNLEVNRKEEKIYLVVRDINYNVIDKGAYWFFDDLKMKLKEKLQYLGFVHASSKKVNDIEYFKYFKLECYIYKDFDAFLDLIEKNIITVSFTTSPIKYGPSFGKNKASSYFRIGKFDLNKLFELERVVNYGDDQHY